MSCCKSENLLIYNVISCLEYYDHVLFQTFPGASRTGIHNEGLLQRVDAHSHVCRNWGKALTSWWKSAYILKKSCLDHTHHRIPGINPNLNIEQFPPTQKSLFNFCNFGHFVESYQRSGYCSFYQILHNLQMVFVLPILAMATTLRGFWWKNLSKILFSCTPSTWPRLLLMLTTDIATKVLIFSALTYMSEKEIASTSFTSVIDAFW